MSIRTQTSAKVILLGLLAMLLYPGTAESQQIRLSVDAMKASSETIVLARTSRTESFWNSTQTAILTRVTLQVTDRLAGTAPQELEVIVPGGQVGDYIHEVSDMPVFQVDEEAVVFIERHPSGALVVSGGSAGKLDVHVDPVSGVRTVPAALFKPESPEQSGAAKSGEIDDRSERITIDDLKARLRK